MGTLPSWSVRSPVASRQAQATSGQGGLTLKLGSRRYPTSYYTTTSTTGSDELESLSANEAAGVDSIVTDTDPTQSDVTQALGTQSEGKTAQAATVGLGTTGATTDTQSAGSKNAPSVVERAVQNQLEKATSIGAVASALTKSPEAFFSGFTSAVTSPTVALMSIANYGIPSAYASARAASQESAINADTSLSQEQKAAALADVEMQKGFTKSKGLWGFTNSHAADLLGSLFGSTPATWGSTEDFNAALAAAQEKSLAAKVGVDKAKEITKQNAALFGTTDPDAIAAMGSTAGQADPGSVSESLGFAQGGSNIAEISAVAKGIAPGLGGWSSDMGGQPDGMGGTEVGNSSPTGIGAETGGTGMGVGMGGGSACCFITLESPQSNVYMAGIVAMLLTLSFIGRQSDDTMNGVVRRYRDEALTQRQRRGYYKISERLYSGMCGFSPMAGLVRLCMTLPMVHHMSAHFGRPQGRASRFVAMTASRWVTKAWLAAFHVIGGTRPFVRRNGETV